MADSDPLKISYTVDRLDHSVLGNSAYVALPINSGRIIGGIANGDIHRTQRGLAVVESSVLGAEVGVGVCLVGDSLLTLATAPAGGEGALSFANLAFCGSAGAGIVNWLGLAHVSGIQHDSHTGAKWLVGELSAPPKHAAVVAGPDKPKLRIAALN